MTNETTATAGTPNSDTTAQSTAATEAAASAAATAAAATQQKPAEGDTTKPADATASQPAKDGDKPADKPAGDTKPDAKKDETLTPEQKAAKAAEDAKAAGDAPKAPPEKYDAFTLPEGVTLAADSEAKVIAAAKALNLPQEGAQQLANAAVEMQKSFATSMEAKIAEVRSGWEADSRADKEFGGDNFDVNLAVANTAVKAFGSPAFRQLLKDSGVGSHPEFIRTFLNIGKSISQDTTVTGGDGTPSAEATGFTAAASKLYGGKK